MKLYNVKVYLRDGSVIKVSNVESATGSDNIEFYNQKGGGRTSVYKENIVYIVSEVA